MHDTCANYAYLVARTVRHGANTLLEMETGERQRKQRQVERRFVLQSQQDLHKKIMMFHLAHKHD